MRRAYNTSFTLISRCRKALPGVYNTGLPLISYCLRAVPEVYIIRSDMPPYS